jgi:hypothetical protein
MDIKSRQIAGIDRIRFDVAWVLAIAIIIFTSLLKAASYPRFVSPNHVFEAYTTPNTEDGTGMKLLLRRFGSSSLGMLLFSNMRWIDVKWSPDSQFLAVIDHSDGHISDVYVFGVEALGSESIKATLYYHTPNPGTYDVRWDVVGWRLAKRSIILSKEVRDQEREVREHVPSVARSTVIARIGATPLQPPTP